MPPMDTEIELRRFVSERLGESAGTLRGSVPTALTDLEHVLSGRRLIERAERASADLIVIGTRGLTDLEHLNWEVWRSTAFSWDAVPEKCAKPLRSNQNEVPNRAERLVLA